MQWWKKQESPCFSCGECQFTWIYLVPDCANEYDFIDFAKNEEGTEKNKMFDATVALFKKLWGQYASKEDGLYIGNKTY